MVDINSFDLKIFDGSKVRAFLSSILGFDVDSKTMNISELLNGSLIKDLTDKTNVVGKLISDPVSFCKSAFSTWVTEIVPFGDELELGAGPDSITTDPESLTVLAKTVAFLKSSVDNQGVDTFKEDLAEISKGNFSSVLKWSELNPVDIGEKLDKLFGGFFG